MCYDFYMESTLNPISSPSHLKKNLVLGAISVVVVLLGIGTGYLFSGVGKKTPAIGTTGEIKVTKNEAGIADESKFSTTTDGVLEEGGISGEGTYHLVRGNGPSQYAYLTSSVIDLSAFTGKSSNLGRNGFWQKAGWLIDVGKIKVVEGE